MERMYKFMIIMQGKKGIYILLCNLDLFQKKKSVTDMGIWLFNKGPINIKQLNKYKLFKRKSHCVLTNQTFYSIDKYLSYWLDDMQEKVIIQHITILH